MNLPRVRFTIRGMMIAVAAAAPIFIWARSEPHSLVNVALITVAFGSVFARIARDRARGGLGIMAGAISGACALSVISLAIMAYLAIGPSRGGVDASIALLASRVLLTMAVGGALLGAIIGLAYNLSTEVPEAAVTPKLAIAITPEM